MSGAIWATVAGIGFGLFQSINRQAVRGMDVWQSTFMQLAVSSVVLLLGALVTEDLGELRSASAVALAAFLAAGLVHFLVGWTLLNASQKRIGAARTSPLLAATPLFGAVLAALTLSEVPGLVTIAGMLLILAGVYVTVGTGEPAEAGERNGPPRAPPPPPRSPPPRPPPSEGPPNPDRRARRSPGATRPSPRATRRSPGAAPPAQRATRPSQLATRPAPRCRSGKGRKPSRPPPAGAARCSASGPRRAGR
jgi:uncharacterized membrane protein